MKPTTPLALVFWALLIAEIITAAAVILAIGGGA